jgi:integrase
LTPEDAQTFLATARHDWLEAWIIVAMETGLRVGELNGLQWSAFDLDRGILRVERKLLRASATIIEGAPKSKAGIRTLHLSPRAVAALRTHRHEQALRRMRLGPAYQRPDLAFTGIKGQPLHGSAVNAHLKLLAQRAGITAPPMTPHLLRRTFASILLSRGADLAVVSRLLGHARVAMTLGAYRAILPGEEERAVREAWAALDEATAGGVEDG